MPTNEEASSIRGPVYVHQSAPSFYNQLPRFARECGPELDRSLVGADSDEGSLRTVGGQAPKALGIDLRGPALLPLLTSNRKVSRAFPFEVLYRQIVDGERAHPTAKIATSFERSSDV